MPKPITYSLIGIAVVFLILILYLSGEAAIAADGLPSSLIGRQAQLTFPTSGYIIQHQYLSRNSLRWTVIESPQPLERSQAEQTVIAQPLTNNLVMLNWVEYNGTSVSEVIDPAQGKIWAYWTADSTESTNERTGVFEIGTFELIGR